MKQLLQSLKTGDTFIEECPTPSVSQHSVRIKTSKTLISPGTERMLVDFGKSSIFSKAKKQPEKVKQLFDKIYTDGLLATFDAVSSKLNEPIKMGYSNVGVIDKCSDDIKDFKVGDRVVSNGSHSDHVVVNQNLVAHIPENVSDEDASFTVIGSIALQGIRLLKPSLGETIVVIGVGLVGLLSVQILKANGCRVLAADYDQNKLDLAKKYGAEVLNLSSDESINLFVMSQTNGYGADGVLICASTDSNDPIKNAAEISKKKGKIILVGVTGLNIDRSLFYEKELIFQVSCSYGPGRYDENYERLGHDYPYAYVRWTEKRNFEAFLELLSTNKVNVKSLISKKFKFTDAAKAYNSLLDEKDSIGVLLEYDSITIQTSNSIIVSNKSFKPSKPVIGFIGAGNYSSRVLIPNFKKNKAQLHSILTTEGLTGTINARRHSFNKSLTNLEDFLSDKCLNTVVIATKHDSHSNLTQKCLESGRNVWVEKPLAISFDDHAKIEKIYSKVSNKLPQLFVGFNRRFSPLVRKMHSLLSNINIPKSIIITVNAGTLPSQHWANEKKVGGGRIVGEACHFIDLARYIVGRRIEEMNTSLFEPKNDSSYMKDTATFSLKFEDGSIATIHYFANGSSKFEKERVEVFCGNKILQLNNFKNLKGYGWKSFKKISLFRQNKGQSEAVKAFLNSIETGNPCIPIDEILEVSKTTLEIDSKLRSQ